MPRTRRYLVAHVGRRLAGYGGLMLAPDSAHVTNIAVDPLQQRSGVGTRLLLALARDAIAMAAPALTLEVRVGNVAALQLYERFGFAPAGIRKRYYEGRDDAIVMWAHDIGQPAYADRLRADRGRPPRHHGVGGRVSAANRLSGGERRTVSAANRPSGGERRTGSAANRPSGGERRTGSAANRPSGGERRNRERSVPPERRRAENSERSEPPERRRAENRVSADGVDFDISLRVAPLRPVDASTVVLGIETSCDETAAALVMGGRDVLSSVVSSSGRPARRVRRASCPRSPAGPTSSCSTRSSPAAIVEAGVDRRAASTPWPARSAPA